MIQRTIHIKKIIELASNSIMGLSHSVISHKLNIDRRTVANICEELELLGIIQNEKKGNGYNISISNTFGNFSSIKKKIAEDILINCDTLEDVRVYLRKLIKGEEDTEN